jgi:hypothetical protein
MVGCHRNLEILYVGHVLNDALAVVSPLVDAVGEMGPVFHVTRAWSQRVTTTLSDWQF